MAVVVLLALVVAMAAGIAAVAMYAMKLQREGQAGAAAATQDDDDGAAAPRGGRRGGMDRMRAGRLRQRRAAQQAAAEDGSSEEEDDEDGGGREGRREQRRREREEAREAERLAREAKASKVNVYEERRRKREEEREALERAQEEEIRRAAEERQKREDEEAAKWLGQISVEEAGVDAEDGGDSGEAAAARLVAYIQERKMVSIEELATEFRLRSAEVVDRIQALEAQGALTGVMDERGKFIHIAVDEMRAVADFIRGRGRVAIAELAAKSGDLIDLEPRTASSMPSAGAGAGIDFESMLEGEAVAAH